jgi:hypothetical protein
MSTGSSWVTVYDLQGVTRIERSKPIAPEMEEKDVGGEPAEALSRL